MKIGGRNIDNVGYAADTILLAEGSNDVKPLLMKVKEESAKAGLHLNIKMKIMTTEEPHNFNIDKGDTEIVQGFAYFALVIYSHGDCSQEITRRLRLRRAAMEELGKTSKSEEVSLETKAEITHTLVFPITVYRREY